jgi:hypothetical protein
MKKKTIWQRIWDWILAWFIDEFEVTIYFPANKVKNEDGSETIHFNPKNYLCRKVNVRDQTDFRLLTVEGNHVHIKTVDPVGYDIIKTK